MQNHVVDMSTTLFGAPGGGPQMSLSDVADMSTTWFGMGGDIAGGGEPNSTVTRQLNCAVTIQVNRAVT